MLGLKKGPAARKNKEKAGRINSSRKFVKTAFEIIPLLLTLKMRLPVNFDIKKIAQNIQVLTLNDFY